MIGIENAILPKNAPKDGVIYTRAWMVDLILDLAGYLPEKRLADFVALEPSAGDGAFLSGMVCHSGQELHFNIFYSKTLLLTPRLTL